MKAAIEFYFDFSSPYGYKAYFVDNVNISEAENVVKIWGMDRLDQVERWLKEPF